MTNEFDPALKSWIEVDKESDFPVQNIPFGIFSQGNCAPRAATRIGNSVIDLTALAELGYLGGTGAEASVFDQPRLNAFIELGKPVWKSVRSRLIELFSENNAELRNNLTARNAILHRAEAVTMHLPVHVGDYTDFYSSIEHATNVGIMFRDPANALLPNWKHLPVGYHGRSSSIIVSGTPVHRPKGQIKPGPELPPVFGPTKELDFELEMAFIAGKSTRLGTSVSTSDAEDHIFGMLLFNDLSARDIQRWEYVPLGPFLSKNFASVVSPWIVTLDALEPFRVAGPGQEPAVLPYLRFSGDHNFDIHLDVFIQLPDLEPQRVSRSNYRFMYWNMAQQLAHQTVNGCNINVGDLYASGTISGPTPDSLGSMLEIAWKGTKPVVMKNGESRTFIEDHDTIIMHGYGERNGVRIGFGEVVTKILPSIPTK